MSGRADAEFGPFSFVRWTVYPGQAKPPPAWCVTASGLGPGGGVGRVGAGTGAATAKALWPGRLVG